MTCLRIAILALCPDAGHLVPLLRIGCMLKSRGHDVVCFVPQECSALADTFGLATKDIGPALSPVAVKASREFGASTILTASFDVYYRDYYAAIFAQSKDLVAAALRELAARPPNLLLVDNHQFPEVFTGIGAELGAPVVFHDSTGGLQSRAGSLVANVYGKPMPGGKELGVLLAGSVYRLYREAARGYRFWRSGLPRATADAHERLRRLLRTRPPGSRAHLAPTSAGTASTASRRYMRHHFATGLGLLEHCFRGTSLHPDRETFGPILDLPGTPVPAELGCWLRGQAERSVVYVSFGSMINLSKRRLRMLLEAIEALQVPVLWAAGGQKHAFSGLAVPGNVRLEGVLPQWSVLSHEAIGACLTHGGAGTVTECLAASVPMVVMPVMWDQPYNAQFVQDLGAGVRIDWWRLRAGVLTETVHSVLGSPEYRRRVASIAQELRAQRGDESVRRFLQQVADSAEQTSHGSRPSRASSLAQ